MTVALDVDPEHARPWAEKSNPTHPSVVDTEHATNAAFGFTNIPMAVWIDENGVKREDRGADLARISRQQDFLRRTLMAALEKGVFDPNIARALIESLQKYVVRDASLLSIDSILAFAGVLKNLDPSKINTYQVDAVNIVVSGNAVLDPVTSSDNMKAILAIFRGEAPLVDSPDESSTTVAGTATATSVSGPEENVKGDIVPNEDIVC